MPHPFGLLIRGISAAMGWCLLLGMMSALPLSDLLYLTVQRAGVWGVSVLVMAALILGHHFYSRHQRRSRLLGSSCYGLRVSLGTFPIHVEASEPGSASKSGSIWSQDLSIPESHAELCESLSSSMTVGERTAAWAETLRWRAESAACRDIGPGGARHQPLPADKTYRVDPDDPLLPVLGVIRHLPEERRNHSLVWLKAFRELPFQEQHVLSQVLAFLDNPQDAPLCRIGPDRLKLTVRCHRTAALLALVANRADVNTTVNDTPVATGPVTPVAESGVYARFYDLMHTPGRLNGQKQAERLGFLHGEHLYLHWRMLLETLSEDGESPSAIATVLVRELTESNLMLTRWNGHEYPPEEARFRVVFRGKLGAQEHENIFDEMLILCWQAQLPLLSRVRDSRFVPEILGHYREDGGNVPPSGETISAEIGEEGIEVGLTIAHPQDDGSEALSGPDAEQLRDTIAGKLQAMLEAAEDPSQAPVRRNTDGEGRIWFYVSHASIREGLVEGVTEGQVRALVNAMTPGVSSVRNRSKRRVYGFCLLKGGVGL